MPARPLAALDAMLPTTPLTQPPVLRLDAIAALLLDRGFALTELGERRVTAERGIVGQPDAHRELVFVREGPAWYGALFMRRLADIANEDGDALPKYTRRPRAESGGLVTLAHVTTWLQEALA